MVKKQAVFGILISLSLTVAGQNKTYEILQTYANIAKMPRYRFIISLNLAPYKNGHFYDFNEILTSAYFKRFQYRVIEKIDTVFNEDDFSIMKKQMKENENCTMLEKDSLKKYDIDFGEVPSNGKDIIATYRIALPLFSKNGKNAILFVEDLCSGCGDGQLFILKLEKEWKIAGTWQLWIE